MYYNTLGTNLCRAERNETRAYAWFLYHVHLFIVIYLKMIKMLFQNEIKYTFQKHLKKKVLLN